MAPQLIDIPALLVANGRPANEKNFYRGDGGDRWYLSLGFTRDVSQYDFKMRVRHNDDLLFVATIGGSDGAYIDMTNAAVDPAFEIVIVVEAAVVAEIADHEVSCTLEADLDQTWLTWVLPVEGPFNQVGSE
jgi:hypothetical protein